MITRRKAVRLLGSASAGAWLASAIDFSIATDASAAALKNESPRLASGAPMSPERIALIESFKQRSEGLQEKFEAYRHESDFVMPYRFFRPSVTTKVPLVVFLSGSGGQGDDNEKQLGLGNIFGTRVWLLPENQKKFPCYVLAPQTDRGWARYDAEALAKGIGKIIPGLGDGVRSTFEIIDELRRKYAIDDRRIYLTGQSMGGGGTWNAISHRPKFFAAAVPVCGSITTDDGSASIETPLWNFHGDADNTVAVTVSRARIDARRKAGGHPIQTEYAGVGHNAWEWAYTEPELVKWLFAQRRR